MAKMTNTKDLEKLHEKHLQYRSRCLNLIASENYSTPRVRSYLASDFGNRYGCYETLHPEEREYTGNRYIHEFEMATHDLVRDVFKADFVDLRPIGGHMAGMATVLGLTDPGDLVFEVSMADWGHGLVGPMRTIEQLEKTIRVKNLPYDENQKLEVEKAVEMIDAYKPRLIIFGGSGTLFADPIKEIMNRTRHLDETFFAYDASHVTGLIAGGVFKNPLDQGVDIVFGSTHKSFPGPQGGMILSRKEEPFKLVGDALSPALVTSHHLNRLPAFAASLLEMKEYGHDYSKQVIRNARKLGAELDKRGIKVIAAEHGFTDSHILLVNVDDYGTSREISTRLEESNILLSDDFGQSGKEIRLGTPEITRRGMKEKEMVLIAEILSEAIKGEVEAGELRENVADLVTEFAGFEYGFPGTALENFPG
ncbi:MAG: glycine hydroxymethyltransferase [Bacillota bacterium]